MASDNQRFTHISVEPDDDDEFVIEAGSPRAAEETPVEELVSSEDDEIVDDVHDDYTTDESAVGSDAQTPSVNEERSHLEAPAEAEHATGRQAPPRYKEQTEEDLEVPPMSNMQKIIIACALVFLIVALVWYFVSMR